MKEERRSMQRVGIDVGGTFTDLFVWDPRSGTGRTAKSLTTPHDLTDGVFASLEAGGVDLAQVDFLVHGSTTAVNALLERTFPEPAFITTAGFRDVVEIGRIHREQLYEPYQQKPQQLVRRRNRFTVGERMRADGTPSAPLDEQELRAVAKEIGARGIRNVAIGFINSYANGAHEARAKEIVLEEIPGALVAISSDVPKFRELGRFVTAIVRAALLPVMGDYFGRLETRLADAGFTGALCVIKSNGGIVRASVAREHPEELIESGPAGGVAAAGHLSLTTGRSQLVTTDMGGTSFDVCLVEDGHGLVRDDYEIAWDMPIIAPMLDIRSIGAGGGSIAWLDEGGSLRVGPRSAGSNPGPACYGLGGSAPTVTDANLLLGRLDASLGGRLRLDVAAAEAAIATVAEPLGLDVLTCAEGILHICTESMAGAIKMVSVDRGRDPRDYAVVTFGGAGAMHSAAIAASLGIREVIVPPFAGVASAYGATTMDVRLDAERTSYGVAGELDPETLQQAFAELEREIVARLDDHGFGGEQTRLRRSAGMRYVGQSYEVETQLPDGPLDAAAVAVAVEAFHVAHEREHGVRSDDFAVAFVNLRVTGEGILPKPALDSSAGGGGAAGGAGGSAAGGQLAPAGAPGAGGTRPVYFHGAWHETPVHDSATLRAGHTLDGPAVVQYPETTLVLPPGSRGSVDRFHNVIIELTGAAAAPAGGSPLTTAVGG